MNIPKLHTIMSNFHVADFSTPRKPLKIYFSYETPIAVVHDSLMLVRQNDWGVTTGKHLNHISPDKGLRVPGDVFEKYLADVLDKG